MVFLPETAEIYYDNKSENGIISIAFFRCIQQLASLLLY